MAFESHDRPDEDEPVDPQPTQEMTAPFDPVDVPDDPPADVEGSAVEPVEQQPAETAEPAGDAPPLHPLDELAPTQALARLDPDAPDFEPLRTPDFPVVWRGYDVQAVDAYVADVSGAIELFEQRTAPTVAVQRALERVGEQTAAILQQAQTAADATTRESRSAADDRVQAAEREARELHDEAVARVRALDDDVERLWDERQRLIEATKELADRLRAIAEEGEARFPAAAAPPPPGEPGEPSPPGPSDPPDPPLPPSTP